MGGGPGRPFRGGANLTPTPRPDYDLPVPTAIESLSGVPLFANLSARQLRKLAKNASEDSYEAGSSIVTEGGRTETLFVVLEGKAKVTKNGRTVARRSPGEFFGELSMIDGRRRAASVIAETPMRCLVLYHDVLRKLVMDDPGMAWSLLLTLAGRVRDT
jgi:CRP/FNR family cyclic AMP-dependent transcriptional regulator